MKSLGHRHPIVFFTLFLTALFTVLIFITLSVHADYGPKGIAESTPSGKILYTQFSLFHEDYFYRTTNYRKGTLVPVNTEVKFVEANPEQIVVKLPDGKKLTIQNIEQHSRAGIDDVFKCMFDTKPIDLSSFTEDEKKAIMQGEVKVGMRKAAVLVALGYPPKHQTPNLEYNQWQYWRNRFVRFVVIFEGDTVTQF